MAQLAMTLLDLAFVDLRELSTYLQRSFADQPPIGAIEGRTQMRDAVVEHLGCSQLEAEELVDSMVDRGMLVFRGGPGEPGRWDIELGV